MSAFPKAQKNISLTAFTLIAFAAQVNASPLELDTPDAHIVIVRPIDHFGVGAQKLSNRQLDKHEDKAYAFTYYYGNKKDKLYVKATDDDVNPIPFGVKEAAAKYGFTPNSGTFGNTGISDEILHPQTLSPAEAKELTTSQNASWKNTVISMGDPSRLVERADSAQTAANWRALGGILGGAILGAFAGNAIGNPINAGGGAAIGGQFGISSSYSGNYPDLIGFNLLPSVDYSKYKTIDVRKVTLIQRSGNIIIAYKNERTDEAEQIALLTAIPALLGFDETVDQIKEARTLDLANRQKVWDECAKAGLVECNKSDKE